MKPRPEEQTSCHSSFSAAIICGPHRELFAVRDHLRSNLGMISGLEIICGRGSFAALYRSPMRSAIEYMGCLITPRAEIFIVTSVLGCCLFDKRARYTELKSVKLTVYKCFSSHCPLQEPPCWPPAWS